VSSAGRDDRNRILSGGTCLEDSELWRNDEVYLDAVGAQCIPDPSTAGDFCRRFASEDVETLPDTLNEVRLGIWRQQPAARATCGASRHGNPFPWTAQRYDAGVGLYHFLFRTYSSETPPEAEPSLSGSTAAERTVPGSSTARIPIRMRQSFTFGGGGRRKRVRP
jgi:hypothetical protein